MHWVQLQDMVPLWQAVLAAARQGGRLCLSVCLALAHYSCMLVHAASTLMPQDNKSPTGTHHVLCRGLHPRLDASRALESSQAKVTHLPVTNR